MKYIASINDKHSTMNTCSTMSTLQIGNWYQQGTKKRVYLGSIKGKPIYAETGKNLHSRMRHLRLWVLACNTSDPKVKERIIRYMIKNA